MKEKKCSQVLLTFPVLFIRFGFWPTVHSVGWERLSAFFNVIQPANVKPQLFQEVSNKAEQTLPVGQPQNTPLLDMMQHEITASRLRASQTQETSKLALLHHSTSFIRMEEVCI